MDNLIKKDILLRRGRDTRDVCTHRGYGERAALCKPVRQASGETKPHDTLVSDFLPPELGENKFLLFKSPSPLYFVMAALAD